MPDQLLPRQGQRLLQIGVALLLYSSLDGFVIPYLWPRLVLGAAAARAAFWLLIYSAFAILGAYTIAAAWGAGNETIRLMGELPHGLAHGSAFQEAFIKIIAYSSASGLISFTLILWGLRIPYSPPNTRPGVQ